MGSPLVFRAEILTAQQGAAGSNIDQNAPEAGLMRVAFDHTHGVSSYRARAGEGVWLAIVHVPSQWRHRQHVDTVMTLANVSKAVP
jgi:hypothetical protein